MISFRVGIAGTTRPRAKWPVTADDDADVHKKFAPNRRQADGSPLGEVLLPSTAHT
jgi:hypothetical protein